MVAPGVSKRFGTEGRRVCPFSRTCSRIDAPRRPLPDVGLCPFGRGDRRGNRSCSAPGKALPLIDRLVGWRMHRNRVGRGAMAAGGGAGGAIDPRESRHLGRLRGCSHLGVVVHFSAARRTRSAFGRLSRPGRHHPTLFLRRDPAVASSGAGVAESDRPTDRHGARGRAVVVRIRAFVRADAARGNVAGVRPDSSARSLLVRDCARPGLSWREQERKR